MSRTLLALLLITVITAVECRTKPSPTSQNTTMHHQKKIQKACNKTDHYDLCVAILSTDGRTHGSDLKGFARIVMQRELAVTMDLLSSAQSVAYASHLDVKLRSKCRECVKLFKSIVFQHFPKVYQSVAFGRYDFAIDSLLMIGSKSMTCSADGEATCPLVSPGVRDMSHVVIGLLKSI